MLVFCRILVFGVFECLLFYFWQLFVTFLDFDTFLSLAGYIFVTFTKWWDKDWQGVPEVFPIYVRDLIKYEDMKGADVELAKIFADKLGLAKWQFLKTNTWGGPIHKGNLTNSGWTGIVGNVSWIRINRSRNRVVICLLVSTSVQLNSWYNIVAQQYYLL